MDNELDVFEREAAKPPNPDNMRNATEMAARMAWLEAYSEKLETKLAEVKKRLHHYKTVVVPEAMAAARLAGFKLDESAQVEGESFAGVEVNVGEFVSGSLPKDEERRAAAVAWLEAHNAAALVRNVLTVDIPKTKQNDVHRVIDMLKAEGYQTERKSDVHPMSLQAFARERLRKGEELDADRLGLFVGRAAKLKFPRKTGEY